MEINKNPWNNKFVSGTAAESIVSLSFLFSFHLSIYLSPHAGSATKEKNSEDPQNMVEILKYIARVEID